MNAGKRSVALDLRSAEAAPVWRELIANADVIVQNLDDSATEKLGIGYEACRALNPQIVYCHIKAFGPGAYEGRPVRLPA